MSAELLRAAAALMRERAETCIKSAPAVDDGHWWNPRELEQALEEWGAFAGLADAEHVASWHPAVALAVADWLDRAASTHDEDDCFTLPYPAGCYEAHDALAVARAYLGRDE